MKKLFGFMIACVLAFGGANSRADAATIAYQGHAYAATVHAYFTITTDGTIGRLAPENILSFTVTVSDRLGAMIGTFGSADGGLVTPSVSYVVANATSLEFEDRRSASIVLSQNPQGSPHPNEMYLRDDRAYISIVVNGVWYADWMDGANSLIFATVPGAVPEPAAWVMMIFGFGMIGAALRRRQSVSVRVDFA